jgi:hypothetical protein
MFWNYMTVQAFRADRIDTAFFWVIVQCTLVDGYLRLGRPYFLFSTPWSCSQQNFDIIASVNHMWPPKIANIQEFNRPTFIQAFNRTTFIEAFKRTVFVQALYCLLSFKHSTVYCHTSFQNSYWHSNIRETTCHSSVQYRIENLAFKRLIVI